MDSVQEILESVSINGFLEGSEGRRHGEAHINAESYVDDDLVNEIRRAALVEAIRGLGLEWVEAKQPGHWYADVGEGDRYVVDMVSGCEMWGHSLRIDPYTVSTPRYTRGGKTGALADYRRRWASAFEKQFPGITEEVAND